MSRSSPRGLGSAIVGRPGWRRLLAAAGIVAAHGLAIIALQRYSEQPRPGASPPTSLRVTLMPARPPASPAPQPAVEAAVEAAAVAPAPPAPPAVPPEVAAPASTPPPESGLPLEWGPAAVEGAAAGAVIEEPVPAPAEPDVTAAPMPPDAGAPRVPDAPAPPSAEPEPTPATLPPEIAMSREPPAATAAAGAMAPSWPMPTAVAHRFRVFYGDYREGQAVAELAYSLELVEGRYLLKAEARATGLTALFWSGALTQRSSGRIGPAGLEPDRYVEQRGRRPERWASIDRGRAVASFSGGERVPLVPGTQDRLSVLVQLGLIARAQPGRVANGQQIELPELGNRAIAAVRYTSLGDEVLSIDDATLRALHLQRRDGEAGRMTTVDIWLGYDQDLMPVRIRFTDPGGRVLDQILAP